MLIRSCARSDWSFPTWPILKALLPPQTLALLLEETARAAGDDYFGLHFGEGFNPKNIGPVVYVVLNSPTIGAGIENVERYLKIHNEAARWFTRIEGDRATWDINWRNWGLKSRANITRPAW